MPHSLSEIVLRSTRIGETQSQVMRPHPKPGMRLLTKFLNVLLPAAVPSPSATATVLLVPLPVPQPTAQTPDALPSITLEVIEKLQPSVSELLTTTPYM